MADCKSPRVKMDQRNRFRFCTSLIKLSLCSGRTTQTSWLGPRDLEPWLTALDGCSYGITLSLYRDTWKHRQLRKDSQCREVFTGCKKSPLSRFFIKRWLSRKVGHTEKTFNVHMRQKEGLCLEKVRLSWVSHVLTFIIARRFMQVSLKVCRYTV